MSWTPAWVTRSNRDGPAQQRSGQSPNVFAKGFERRDPGPYVALNHALVKADVAVDLASVVARGVPSHRGKPESIVLLNHETESVRGRAVTVGPASDYTLVGTTPF